MTIPLPDEPFAFPSDRAPDGPPDVVDRPTLRASGPSEIVQVIPYLLGFHPEDSVVLIGLRGRRISVSARYDLDCPPVAAEPWVAAARRVGADRVVTVIYSDAPTTGALPHRGYLDELSDLFASHGLDEVDALLVGNGRWWSYRCADDDCCPRAGTPVDREGAVAVSAVAGGLVALPTRRELEKELEPDAAGVDEVSAALLRLFAADLAAESPSLKERRAADWSAVRDFVRNAETPGFRPSADEAARVLAALDDVVVRDATIGYLAAPPNRQVADAWRDLTRVAPQEMRAPAATVYALWCFARGSGARTNVAIDAALAADPDYTMAHLLADLQNAGMNPFELIHDLAQECRLVGRRIQRKRDPRPPERRRKGKNREHPR